MKRTTIPKTPTTAAAAPSESAAVKPLSGGAQTVIEMPLDELRRRTTLAAQHLREALALLPGLLTLTADERQRSGGRLRSGEGDVYRDILSIIEGFPAFFAGLAELDGGEDPKKVETDLLRDRIERAEVLAPLAGILEPFGDVSDTVLHLRGLVRRPVAEAYGIAKSIAKTNAALRSRLARATDYYAAIGKASAAARKANAAAKQQDGRTASGTNTDA